MVDQRGASAGQVVGAVRGLLNEPWPPSGSDQHRVDLLRACGLELDDAVSASSRKDWSWAAAAAVQTIGELTDRRDHLLELVTKERADNVQLREQVAVLNGATRWESEDDTRLRDELTRTGAEVERLRGSLQEAESRLIWYRAAIATLRERLGLDHLEEDDDVMERMLEAIAGAAHAISRHQSLATSAEERADYLQDQVEQLTGASEVAARVERELRAEIERLTGNSEQVETGLEQNEAVDCCFGPDRDDYEALLNLALAALRCSYIDPLPIAEEIERARREI